MEKDATVSVIITCHNYAHYLPEAIESVLQQTYRDFEIIVVNDGATDNTTEVALKYPVTLIEQPNRGLPAARNCAIQLARGRYILPLDADDRLAPAFLEKTVSKMEQTEGVIRTGVRIFGDLESVARLYRGVELEDLLVHNPGCYCSLFPRKAWEAVGGYDENMRDGYEDWEFWIRVVSRGWKIFIIDEPLFCYRKHSSSMYQTVSAKKDADLRAYIRDKHKELYEASRAKQHTARNSLRMEGKTKKIALLSVNRFNPILCDGVSNSILELLVALHGRGYSVGIYNFLTNEAYKNFVFNYLPNAQHGAQSIVWQDATSYEMPFKGINLHQELLPCSENELVTAPQHSIRLLYKAVSQCSIDYAFTLEDDFISLLVAVYLGIPGAHFFHSPAYVEHFFNYNSGYIKILRSRTVAAVSKFVQDKLQEFLISAHVCHPLFNLNSYQTQGREDDAKAIGFYSGGSHKGDAIVNMIIEKLPQYNFIVVGRNYWQKFNQIPPNLKYLGDLPEIKEFYRKVKLLLAPSLVPEGFSRVILEAAVNGIPAIANRIGGIPEAMGDSGILVDVDFTKEINVDEIADKYVAEIERLMNDEQVYARYSQKAIERARQYQVAQNKLLEDLVSSLGV